MSPFRVLHIILELGHKYVRKVHLRAFPKVEQDYLKIQFFYLSIVKLQNWLLQKVCISLFWISLIFLITAKNVSKRKRSLKQACSEWQLFSVEIQHAYLTCLLYYTLSLVYGSHKLSDRKSWSHSKDRISCLIDVSH